MKKIYLLCCHTLAVIVLFGSVSLTAMAQQENAIIMFGDSITMGGQPGPVVGKYVNGGFSHGLTAKRLDILLSSRRGVTINYGWGGSATDFGVQRVGGVITDAKNKLPANNYFMLILYGTNDIPRGVSAGTVAFNIRQIMQAAGRANITPVVGNLLPRSDYFNAIPTYNNSIRAQFNRYNAAVANGSLNALKGYFVDHYSAFNVPNYTNLFLPEPLGPGGSIIYLHPKNQGYETIANLWFDQALKDIIAGGVTISPILMLLLDE